MLLARLLGGNRRTKATTRHHPGRIGRGTGGQLEGIGEVVAQPLAALGKGLGVGEHLTNPFQGATAEQRVPNRQDQSPGHRQVPMLPEGIHTGGHPSLHGVLYRHHRSIGAATGQGLHHGPNPQLGQQLGPHKTLQLHQMAGCLLAIGAHRTEIGNAHGSFEEATRPKQADKIMPRQPADDVPGFQRQSAIAT